MYNFYNILQKIIMQYENIIMKYITLKNNTCTQNKNNYLVCW